MGDVGNAYDGDHRKRPLKAQPLKGERRVKRNKSRTRMTKSTITAWWGAEQMHQYDVVIAWTCKWGQSAYYL